MSAPAPTPATPGGFTHTPMLLFRSEVDWPRPKYVRVRYSENDALSQVRKKKQFYPWWHVWIPANGYTLSGDARAPTKQFVTQEYINRIRQHLPAEVWAKYVGDNLEIIGPSSPSPHTEAAQAQRPEEEVLSREDTERIVTPTLFYPRLRQMQAAREIDEYFPRGEEEEWLAIISKEHTGGAAAFCPRCPH